MTTFNHYGTRSFSSIDGTAASITAISSGTITITGLSNMSASLVGNLINLSNAATAANNGTYLITEYVSSSSVKAITGTSGTDANNGSISWSMAYYINNIKPNEIILGTSSSVTRPLKLFVNTNPCGKNLIIKKISGSGEIQVEVSGTKKDGKFGVSFTTLNSSINYNECSNIDSLYTDKVYLNKCLYVLGGGAAGNAQNRENRSTNTELRIWSAHGLSPANSNAGRFRHFASAGSRGSITTGCGQYGAGSTYSNTLEGYFIRLDSYGQYGVTYANLTALNATSPIDNGSFYISGGYNGTAPTGAHRAMYEYLLTYTLVRDCLYTNYYNYVLNPTELVEYHVFGGYQTSASVNTNHRYNIITDTWTAKTTGTANYGGCFFGWEKSASIAGGWTTSTANRRYDFLNNTWTNDTNISTSSSNCGSALTSSLGLSIGGGHRNGYIFERSLNTWYNYTSINSTDTSCYYASGTAI